MHENKVALCLGGGFLTPWPRGASVNDHHVAAGRLVLQERVPGLPWLADARGGLDYGHVLLVEVDLRACEGLFDDESTITVLPLQAVTRVVFPTEEAMQAFSARVAGYGDIGPNLPLLAVDGELFAVAGGRSGELPLTGAQAATLKEVPGHSGPDRELAQLLALDRQAGALTALLWAVAASGTPGVIRRLEGLLDSVPALGLAAEPLIVAIANALDEDACSSGADIVVREVVRLVTRLPANDGIDTAELLDRLDSVLKALPVAAPALVPKFLRFAQDVLDARRDLPDGTFADEGGSIALRAVLLFLLNHDPDRLDALRAKVAGLGARVYALAASLVGCHAGMASLGREMKADSSRFAAVPRLSLELARGTAPRWEIADTWDDADGHRETCLVWRGARLAGARSNADPDLVAIAVQLRHAGYAASFDVTNGLLTATKGEADGLVVRVVRWTAIPVFPREPGARLSIDCADKQSKAARARLAATINATAATNGVFAELLEGRGMAGLRLDAFVRLPASMDTLVAGLDALRVAHASVTSSAK